ncbi:glycoside hydrolase family 15 protein [Actinophytocola oryzae]|uniref:GH15 family glucan-1,4-alpha-glucosidase n=1 Tax=Actinophytocola oryzae TaxID=502181 RepID=A0A4R7VFI5_9PSEU|nr:glycoside hydrolase family 15 protein [Actinophytocola oryzae]TDV48004.1 GH15 family glucan-1,4-alpha-glucosidase [Actinophytocola oryzae]
MALIEDYAMLGDLQTAALVSRTGGIDWLCLPRFDSPACFAALLDDEEAGTWQLAPRGGGPATRRAYRGDSLVLDSEWDTPEGTVRVTDLMPPRGANADVVRVVEGVSGRVPMRMTLRVRFGYGAVRPWLRREDGRLVAVAGPDAVWLRTPVDLDARHDERHTAAHAEFTVAEGDRVPFVLTYRPSHLGAPEPVEAEDALRDTEKYWADWISRCRYDGRWGEAVRRALVTLKALTYAPTGGILAAPTTSLPEQLGGSRNWDYRYCWLRDATFTLQALLETGYVDEARAWREWLVRAVAGDPGDLQVVYGLDGTRHLPERTLDHLTGYEKSTPVRVGNGAVDQLQLDVLGEVLTGLHLCRESGVTATDTAWQVQRELMDHLEGNWQLPDNSLWEFRGRRQHFVHSKVTMWSGVDRAVRAVETHGLPGPVDRWRRLRDTIHAEVCERGYDAERGTFTQFYGSTELDAALLLVPRVGFLPWRDERVLGTVDAIRADLVRDGLIERYEGDGLPG